MQAAIGANAAVAEQTCINFLREIDGCIAFFVIRSCRSSFHHGRNPPPASSAACDARTATSISSKVRQGRPATAAAAKQTSGARDKRRTKNSLAGQK
jgi:hypothetical protein